MDHPQIRPITHKSADEIAKEEGLGSVLSSEPLNDDQKVYMAKQFLRRIQGHCKHTKEILSQFFADQGVKSHHVAKTEFILNRMDQLEELIDIMQSEMNRHKPMSEPPNYEA